MLPFLWELGPNFHVGTSSTKIEKVQISLVLLNFLCLMRPFWEFQIVSKILVKTSLKVHRIGVDLELTSTFGPTGLKLGGKMSRN